MPQLLASASPSLPPSVSVFYEARGRAGRASPFGFDPKSYSMGWSKTGLPELSLPDPPRPPTPGPPPRPPPIPPRPPVPTPPPSPSSMADVYLLRGLVAEQLSAVAARLVDVWFALGVPASLPHPPRPPTPGPRPGPVGPRPDVPTPPPSPRRSAEGLVEETTPCGGGLEIGCPGEAPSRRSLNEHLDVGSSASSPAGLTTSYDPRKDDRVETRLHALVYRVDPGDESDPRARRLGSCSVSESSCSSLTLHAGAGVVRNDPDLLRASSSRQLPKAGPDLFDAARGLSLFIAWPATSGVHSSPASSIPACTCAFDRRLDARSLRDTFHTSGRSPAAREIARSRLTEPGSRGS